jgi:hypothetical protein
LEDTELGIAESGTARLGAGELGGAGLETEELGVAGLGTREPGSDSSDEPDFAFSLSLSAILKIE